MPKAFANDPKRLDRAPGPDLVRVLLIAFGIALLLGLVSGLGWVGYNLIRVSLFG